MLRPPSPTNKVAINLLNHNDRDSIISEVKPVYQRTRSSYHPPRIQNNTGQYPRASPYQQQQYIPQIRISQTVLLRQPKNNKIIAVFLCSLMMLLMICKVTIIREVCWGNQWLHIFKMVLISQVLVGIVLRILGVANKTSFLLLKEQLFKSKGKQVTKIFNESTRATSPLKQAITSNNLQPTSIVKIIIVITTTIIYNLFFTLSFVKTSQLYIMIYSLTIVPIILSHIQIQYCSSSLKIILVTLISISIICSLDLNLIIACSTAILMCHLMEQNILLQTLAYYLQVAMLLGVIVLDGLGRQSIFAMCLYIGCISIGILLTQYIADVYIRKQMYLYFIYDYVLDCLMCIIPLILMVIDSQINYLIIFGCVCLFCCRFILRNDYTITLDSRQSIQMM